MFRSLLTALSLTALLGATVPAHAAPGASDWVDEEFASVRLISARETLGNNDMLRLGLQFALKPDWKIYWRSAGDAGFPPQLDWSGSTNIGDAQIQWPAPHRFSIFGLETFGYKDEIILPIDAKIPDHSQNAHISLNVDYLVCSDICIPAKAAFTLDIPAITADANGTNANGNSTAGTPSGVSRFAHDIEKFAALVPLRGDNLPITVADAWVSTMANAANSANATTDPNGSNTILHVSVSGMENAPGNSSPDPVEILVEGRPRLAFGAPRPVANGNNQTNDGTAQDSPAIRLFDLPVYGLEAGESLSGQELTITVIDGPLAIEQRHVVTDAPTNAMTAAMHAANAANGTAMGAGNDGSRNLWIIGALALLGGFILNFMPCVLPVLSIKVLSALKARSEDRGRVRSGFLASAGGIVFSFWLIAGALIAVKLAGGTIGWGIQFQQPLFLTVMTIIVTLFACNMWGLFEINGPASLGNAANDAITARENRGHHLGGNFMTGMFATLLATPCSAPFLGTAVGFALAGSNFDIVWIFTLLGVGLALPYLLIAARPELARLLPRPGRWMGIVRAVMGIALAGTAVWLLSVLFIQIGLAGTIVIAAALIIAALLLVIRKKSAAATPRLASTAIAGIAILVALFAPGFVRPAAQGNAQGGTIQADALNWQPFAPAQIPALVAQGKTVLVDITAQWCVTCQVNKRLVLETADIANLLAGDDIVLMQGDWTRPDQTIADYLAGYGRYGIPFNAVFGPKAPDGIILSELLSTDAVRDALNNAGTGGNLAAR